MYVGVLLTCMSVHVMNAWFPERPKEGIISPELELHIGIRLHVGSVSQISFFWKNNQGS